MVPTPTASDSKGSRRTTARTNLWKSNPGLTLLDYAWLWPTPKATVSGPDFARVNRPRSGGDDLATAVARLEAFLHGEAEAPLNPEWVSWLMGYVMDWTDLVEEAVGATP